MKRLIIKTSLLIFVPVFLTSLYMLSEKNEHSLYSHEANVKLAYERLQALGDTTKIIIVAGSNAGLGFDSQILKDSFNMPVVNTGTHAGIGTRLQFELYKELITPRDIVIFCPEYYENISRLYGESTVIRVLSTHMPSAYLKVSFNQWLHIFKYIGIHHVECCRSKGAQEFDGVYSRKVINQFGDNELHREHNEIWDKRTLCGDMDEETWNYYKYVHEYAQTHGIRLIYLPPTFMESNYKSQEAQIDSLDRNMASHGIPYMSSPITFMFPDSFYIDTPYHMTTEGAKQRTLVVVKELKRILKQ